MVKLLEANNTNSMNILAKAMANTNFSDDQVDIIRRANNILSKLNDSNLDVSVEVNNQGAVKLSIPIGKSGISMVVSNTNQPVEIQTGEGLVLNDSTMKEITEIFRIVMSL